MPRSPDGLIGGPWWAWSCLQVEVALLASFMLSAVAELRAMFFRTATSSCALTPLAHWQVLATEAALVVNSSFYFLALVASGEVDGPSRAVRAITANLTFLVLSVITGQRAAGFFAEAAPATILPPEAACLIAAIYMILCAVASTLMSVYGLSFTGFEVVLCCALVAHASSFAATASEANLPAAVFTLQTMTITDSFLLFMACFTASNGFLKQGPVATLICTAIALTSSIAGFCLVIASAPWQHDEPCLDPPLLPAALLLQTETGASLHLLLVPERFRRGGLGCTVVSWLLSLVCITAIAAQIKSSSEPKSRPQEKSRWTAEATVALLADPARQVDEGAFARNASPQDVA
jgi:hypothetical protein